MHWGKWASRESWELGAYKPLSLARPLQGHQTASDGQMVELMELIRRGANPRIGQMPFACVKMILRLERREHNLCGPFTDITRSSRRYFLTMSGVGHVGKVADLLFRSTR